MTRIIKSIMGVFALLLVATALCSPAQADTTWPPNRSGMSYANGNDHVKGAAISWVLTGKGMDPRDHVTTITPTGNGVYTNSMKTEMVIRSNAGNPVQSYTWKATLRNGGFARMVNNRIEIHRLTFDIRDLHKPISGGSAYDGGVMGGFAKPYAIDRTGKQLPTGFSVHNAGDWKTFYITQTVNFAGAKFPVKVDPEIDWGIISGHVYFNRDETALMTQSTYLAAFCAALSTIPEMGTFIAIQCGANFASVLAQANAAYAAGGCLAGGLGSASLEGIYTYYGGYCS